VKVTYIRELDGVRGIAALMVMFFHFFQGLSTIDPVLLTIKKISLFGQTGVSLFFVLSGFLITRILVSTKESEHYFSYFYIRRCLRIFPLYYLFLIIFYFLIPLISKIPVSELSLQVYYWIYLQDFARTFGWSSSGPPHFWSLAVEEHFYLFWPFIIYYFDKRKIVYIIISIILVAMFTRIILVYLNYEVFYFTFSRMDELAIGALLGIFEIKKKLQQGKKGTERFLLFSLIILIISTVLLWTYFSGEANPVLQVTKFLFISGAYFTLIGYIITASESLYIKKLLRSKFLIYTGKISYGLYVYHISCFWFIGYIFESDSIVLNFFSHFFFSYLIATSSYYLFEQKFLRLKENFK
jgi:peptidoglycan/LPS O-acetylase OafA/YrhL